MPAKRSCHCWGLNYNLCWAAAINLKMDEKFFWYTNISSIWPLIANWNPELLLKGELLTFVPKTKDLKTHISSVLRYSCRPWKLHCCFLGGKLSSSTSTSDFSEVRQQVHGGSEREARTSHLLPFTVISLFSSYVKRCLNRWLQHDNPCKSPLDFISYHAFKPAWITYQQLLGWMACESPPADDGKEDKDTLEWDQITAAAACVVLLPLMNQAPKAAFKMWG